MKTRKILNSALATLGIWTLGTLACFAPYLPADYSTFTARNGTCEVNSGRQSLYNRVFKHKDQYDTRRILGLTEEVDGKTYRGVASIIDDGLALTNHHLVDRARKRNGVIKLDGMGRSYNGHVVSADIAKDLAL